MVIGNERAHTFTEESRSADTAGEPEPQGYTGIHLKDGSIKGSGSIHRARRFRLRNSPPESGKWEKQWDCKQIDERVEIQTANCSLTRP